MVNISFLIILWKLLWFEKNQQESLAVLGATGMNGLINPSNTEANFVQSTMMQRLDENQPNPVMLVFIG